MNAEKLTANLTAIDRWRASHHCCEVVLSANETVDGGWILGLIDWGPKCERRGGPFKGDLATVIEQGARWCEADDKAVRDEQVAEDLHQLAIERAEEAAVERARSE